MNWSLYAAFVLAATTLIVVPGPNLALIVANSIAYGTRLGLATVLGTSAAMIVQLALTVFGIAFARDVVADWFVWLRWIGVVYLVSVGVATWRAPPGAPCAGAPSPRSLRRIVLRGFWISLTNPKTLLFYAAFFPQFISVNGRLTRELPLLSATFLGIAVALDSVWAVLAGRAREWLFGHARFRTRLASGILIFGAVSLAILRG